MFIFYSQELKRQPCPTIEVKSLWSPLHSPIFNAISISKFWNWNPKSYLVLAILKVVAVKKKESEAATSKGHFYYDFYNYEKDVLL